MDTFINSLYLKLHVKWFWLHVSYLWTLIYAQGKRFLYIHETHEIKGSFWYVIK
jgi:hypothetical protein